MAMSRKHYEGIARILNERGFFAHNSYIVDRIAEDLARMFADDNPRFDADRFFKAVKREHPASA